MIPVHEGPETPPAASLSPRREFTSKTVFHPESGEQVTFDVFNKWLQEHGGDPSEIWGMSSPGRVSVKAHTRAPPKQTKQHSRTIRVEKGGSDSELSGAEIIKIRREPSRRRSNSKTNESWAEINQAAKHIQRWDMTSGRALENFFAQIETIGADTNVPYSQLPVLVRLKMDPDAMASFAQSEPKAAQLEYNELKAKLCEMFGYKARNPYPFWRLLELQLQEGVDIQTYIQTFLKQKGRLEPDEGNIA